MMVFSKESKRILPHVIAGALALIAGACSWLRPQAPMPTVPVLQDFSASLMGKGTHGTVLCVQYQGRSADLAGLTLQATISRAGEVIESGITAETMAGDTCFEMVDAKYVSTSSNIEGESLVISPQPLTLSLQAFLSDGQQPANGDQTLLLGPYVQFPFLNWIFPESARPACVAGGHTREGVFYPAWDIIPEPSIENPTLVGTPVLAPVDGTAYVWLLPNGEPGRRFDTVNAVLIYSEATGFAVDLTHEADVFYDGSQWRMITTLNGQPVSAGTQIGVIGPKDHASSIPHTHLQVFIPPEPPSGKPDANRFLYVASTANSTGNIDAIKQGLFLDAKLNEELLALSGQFLRCENYPWGELEIPQQLPFTADGRRDDWKDLEPALRDKEGDSAAGDVLDLRSLNSALDDNYLYLLIEAGQEPEGRWALDIFVDLHAKNACGSSERSIKVWSDQPGAFTIASVDNCPDSAAQTYPAVFAWGEAFELRIPLVYLNNPVAVDVLSVKGILVDERGGYSYPDYMR